MPLNDEWIKQPLHTHTHTHTHTDTIKYSAVVNKRRKFCSLQQHDWTLRTLC